MLEFIIANIAPLIIGAVLLILVSVVLAFFIRGRASREKSQDDKMESKLPKKRQENQILGISGCMRSVIPESRNVQCI